MKWAIRGLSFLAFTFQYIVPLVLFGTVFAYTHGGMRAGLTSAGYIACAIFAIILLSKAKAKILAKKKGTGRAVLLSFFPIALWAVLFFGFSWFEGLVANLCDYWDKVLIFIILGRMLYIAEETLEAAHET